MKTHFDFSPLTKKLKVLSCLFCALCLFGSHQSFAQAKKGDKDKRTSTIDFEDELIEGEVKKPELFYLLQKKQFNFKRLIKLRQNFLPEMNRSSEELRHLGSKK